MTESRNASPQTRSRRVLLAVLLSALAVADELAALA